jgi:serine/threonine protein kinase
MAPEILKSDELMENEKFSCDFWSIGVILFQLLSGVKPFASEDRFELI